MFFVKTCYTHKNKPPDCEPTKKTNGLGSCRETAAISWLKTQTKLFLSSFACFFIESVWLKIDSSFFLFYFYKVCSSSSPVFIIFFSLPICFRLILRAVIVSDVWSLRHSMLSLSSSSITFYTAHYKDHYHQITSNKNRPASSFTNNQRVAVSSKS